MYPRQYNLGLPRKTELYLRRLHQILKLRITSKSKPMKTCTRCGEAKDEALFNRKKQNRNGLHPWCRDCCHKHFAKWLEKKGPVYKEEMNRRTREGQQVRRAEIAKVLDDLRSVPCPDCLAKGWPANHPPYIMQFHHRDPSTKSFNLSKAYSMTSTGTRIFKRIQDEAAKCDIICSNCHLAREHGHKLRFRTI